MRKWNKDNLQIALNNDFMLKNCLKFKQSSEAKKAQTSEKSFHNN